MTGAIVARRRGDDFQARIFWLNAAALLDSVSPIVRVAYERGPKAFDDVLIEYDPEHAPRDHAGLPICVEHIQCKWHTTAGTFGYEDLIAPEFLNATRYSLLERAQQARLAHGTAANGLRFELKTNWRIRADDPLLQLVGKSSDALDVDRLFSGQTDRSRMGKVRKSWREHLGVDDTELRQLVRWLAIAETPESLASLRQRLDERFALVGLRRVPVSDSAFFYDDLVAKLLAQNRVDFDRNTFREMAAREGILGEDVATDKIPVVGVRSFMHPIDRLENRCDRMLDLVPHFDGRYIRREGDWQARIAPKLRDFLFDAARQEERLRLVLDAHVSLAFAAGALLNMKSGRYVEIEQRTVGRRFWSSDDRELDSTWPGLVIEDEVTSGGEEIAIAVGLTHDVAPAVRGCVKDRLPKVGRIVHCRPQGGASQQSVHCGRHAWQLAESVVRHLVAIRGQGQGASPVHLFFAGPNGFVFFLGQQRAIGTTWLYEWDFEGQREGGYSFSLSVTG